MAVVFPHANGFKVTDENFRAAWVSLCEQYCFDPALRQLPRFARRISILEMEEKGQQRSLEYLCKTLVPNGYKGTAQATRQFLEQNPHVVHATDCNVGNPVSGGINVEGVELVGESAAELPPGIEAQFEADVDSEGDDGSEVFSVSLGRIVVLRETSNGPLGPNNGRSTVGSSATVPSFYISRFVVEVHQQDYFRMFRGKLVAPGTPIRGWDARLDAYFWPTPNMDLAANTVALAPLLSAATKLANPVTNRTPWSNDEVTEAGRLVRKIFEWGGVPQREETVTPSNIRKVFEAAIHGPAQKTLMNSGWTKVAAFATSHLPLHQQHVIWDSRVSTAIVKRLDSIFHSDGLDSVPPEFAGVGLVNVGRGGNRPVRAGSLQLKWINGYKSWAAQTAGSKFARSVCVALNSGAVETARKGQWTVRDVEMVLFGDGY